MANIFLLVAMGAMLDVPLDVHSIQSDRWRVVSTQLTREIKAPWVRVNPNGILRAESSLSTTREYFRTEPSVSSRLSV